MRAGEIAAAIYNVNRDPKRHAAPFRYTDIFPSTKQDAAPAAASDAQVDTFFVALAGSRRKAPRKISRAEMRAA